VKDVVKSTRRNPLAPGKVVVPSLADELALTGHTSEEIDGLLDDVAPLWQERYGARHAGHPTSLSIRDKVVMTLLQLQSGAPARTLAPHYGVSADTVNRAIAEIRPLLAVCGVDTGVDNRPLHFPEGIALTCHTIEQIDDLLAKITPLWREAYDERNAARRLERTGEPHPRRTERLRGTLSLRDKLVLTLANVHGGQEVRSLSSLSGAPASMVLRAIAEIAPQLVACGMNTAIDNRPPHFPEGIALTGLTGEEFADLFAVVAPRAAPFGAMPYHRGRPAALTLRDKLMICLAHSSQGLSMKELAAAWGVTANPISSAIVSTLPLFTDYDLRRVRAAYETMEVE